MPRLVSYLNKSITPRRLGGRALVALAAASSAGPLSAQVTAELHMSVTLLPAKAICSAHLPDVHWGTFALGFEQPEATFDVEFDCSRPVAGASVRFDGGQRPTASFPYARAMSRPRSSLPYAMHDVSSGHVFGIDRPMTFSLPSGASTRTFRVTTEGVVPATNKPGRYTDDLVLTFTF